ncbi:MAG: 5'/3'-nucleotidase SurE, partial [Ignavibacteriaceae bacterium]
TAINIIYSGTVSAAREAAIMDVPSIAVSLTNHAGKDFSFAAKVTKLIAKKAEGKDLPIGTLLNINVPDIPEDQIKGIHLTRQGKSKWDDTYEQRKDPLGRNYYWLTGNLNIVDTEIETDQIAIKNNYVSVTPIHFDLTDYETYERMKSWKLEELINGKKN